MKPARRSLLSLALASCAACSSSPTGPSQALAPGRERPHRPSASAVDAEHYFLDLELDPRGRALRGTAHVQLVAMQDGVGVVGLDLVGLGVSAVRDAEGRSLRFEERADGLDVVLPAPLASGERQELAIDYAGAPNGGMWFVAEQDGVPTEVFTQGECEDARRWFPCFDDPADRATSELRVRMPAGWTSIAAGERVESRIEGDERVDLWRMNVPHPTYLTTLVAGEFELVEEDAHGLPLWYASSAKYAPLLASSLADTDEALAFLEEVTGRRYPYPKYSQACVASFPFGGMENISATTLTETALTDERGRRDGGATGLVAHELAHQWFGDLLTCRDWSHVWLNEGFATYMTMLFFERTKGVDDLRVRVRDAQESYMKGDSGEKRRPMVYATYREPMDLFFGGHTYDGGAVRLHLLRNELGDGPFFEGLKRYVADHAGRGVVTDDLRLAMQAASGRDLTEFFQQWFQSPGFPELAVAWSYAPDAKEVRLAVDQLQEPVGGTPAVFRAAVDVEVRTAAGSKLHRVQLASRHDRFTLPCDAPPVWVRFDEHGALPKRLVTQKSRAEWMAIASGDDDPNGRRDALAALGETLAGERDDRAREELLQVVVRRLREDPMPAVRVAAVRALARAGGAEARFHLTVAASADPAAEVRVATLDELHSYGADPALADLAAQCFDAGFSWKTMVAAAGLYASAEPRRSFDWLRARWGIDSPHDVLRAGLVGVMAGIAHEGVGGELRRIALDPALEPTVRAAAIGGLPRALAGDEELRGVLAGLARSSELPVRRAAVAALVETRDPKAVDDLDAAYAATRLPSERRAIEAAVTELSR